MAEKSRLDNRIVALGLQSSREKARSLIIAGQVEVNAQVVSKPSAQVSAEDEITLRAQPPFVSRGGQKLQRAVDVFDFSIEGRVAADVGASTGGFTDCMLQHGAKMVYAIDVGYGQLDWKLRGDERVVVMERTNARNMQPDWFAQPLQLASIDVSFISLKLILPPLFACLAGGADVIALVKPQFEAGRALVGKKGVVRDAAVHAQVLQDVLAFAREGYAVLGLDYSPIKGPEGNIEFLLWLKKGGESAWAAAEDETAVSGAVAQAHQVLSLN